MYTIIILVLFFMAIIYYYVYHRKLYHSDKVVEGNNDIVVDKLMITAHPDDELIFGGRELLHEPGWLVVCVTCATNAAGNKFSLCQAEKRKNEFINVMNCLKCKYQIWDYEDNGFNSNWDTESLSIKIKKIIRDYNFKKIVTHNLQGEYGHIQHRRISEIIHALRPDNLYVFDYTDTDNGKTFNDINPYLTKLEQLLKNYSTQSHIISKYYVNILYQNVKPVYS